MVGGVDVEWCPVALGQRFKGYLAAMQSVALLWMAERSRRCGRRLGQEALSEKYSLLSLQHFPEEIFL